MVIFEKALIIGFILETECCENVADGRWTDRFSALTHAECKLEIDTCYAKALHLIQGVSEDQLVTLANYEVWIFLGWSVQNFGVLGAIQNREVVC